MPGPGPPPLSTDLEFELAGVLARERGDGRDVHRLVRQLLKRDGAAWMLVGVLEGGEYAVWKMAAYLGRVVMRSEIETSGGEHEMEVIGQGEGALDEALDRVGEFAWVHPDYQGQVDANL